MPNRNMSKRVDEAMIVQNVVGAYQQLECLLDAESVFARYIINARIVVMEWHPERRSWQKSLRDAEVQDD